MTPMPDNPGWFIDVPSSRGTYLIVDSAYHLPFLADWFPGEGKRPGRWYIANRPYCEADGVTCWRPLPRLPDRDPPKTRDDSRTIVKD